MSGEYVILASVEAGVNFLCEQYHTRSQGRIEKPLFVNSNLT